MCVFVCLVVFRFFFSARFRYIHEEHTHNINKWKWKWKWKWQCKWKWVIQLKTQTRMFQLKYIMQKKNDDLRERNEFVWNIKHTHTHTACKWNKHHFNKLTEREKERDRAMLLLSGRREKCNKGEKKKTSDECIKKQEKKTPIKWWWSSL